MININSGWMLNNKYTFGSLQRQFLVQVIRLYKYMTQGYNIDIQHMYEIKSVYLLCPLYPTRQQSQEQQELRLEQMKIHMALVWHLVCLLEPLQRGTLPPE